MGRSACRTSSSVWSSLSSSSRRRIAASACGLFAHSGLSARACGRSCADYCQSLPGSDSMIESKPGCGPGPLADNRRSFVAGDLGSPGPTDGAVPQSAPTLAHAEHAENVPFSRNGLCACGNARRCTPRLHRAVLLSGGRKRGRVCVLGRVGRVPPRLPGPMDRPHESPPLPFLHCPPRLTPNRR